MDRYKTSIINIPYEVRYYIDSKGRHTILSPEKTNQLVIAKGESLEKAAEKYWYLTETFTKYYQIENMELRRKALFLKGDWKLPGGKWFQILGINVRFRTGRPVQKGWTIPFTYFNIRIQSLWKINYEEI